MTTDRRRVLAWMSVRQVAARLGFSPRWVRDRIKAGDFGARVFAFNGDVRVPARAVQEFMDRHQVPVSVSAAPHAAAFSRKVGKKG
ncbi:MAG: DNA-binding protein [Proteobacteria bacterium]|nr:DNA-binding protein [Pseudomonadota bacterium]